MLVVVISVLVVVVGVWSILFVGQCDLTVVFVIVLLIWFILIITILVTKINLFIYMFVNIVIDIILLIIFLIPHYYYLFCCYCLH